MKYNLYFSTDTNNTILLQSRDLPEFSAVGDNLEEALAYAVDLLETTFDIYMEENRAIPLPSAAQAGEVAVALPAMAAIKVDLYNEALKQGKRRYALGKELGWAPTQIERFFNVKYASKMETIETVAAKLGKNLHISLA